MVYQKGQKLGILVGLKIILVPLKLLFDPLKMNASGTKIILVGLLNCY